MNWLNVILGIILLFKINWALLSLAFEIRDIIHFKIYGNTDEMEESFKYFFG